MSEFLPWSQDAEEGVLGAILNDADRCYPVVKPLTSHHFFDPQNKIIFAAIEGMVLRNVAVDAITVAEDAKSEAFDEFDLREYLSALSQNAAGSYSAKRYAEIIRSKAAKRALIEAADKAMHIAAGDGEIATNVDLITSLFLGLQKEQIQKVPRSLSEIALQRTQHYEDLQAGTVTAGWPTHIGSLDRMLNGGFRPGGLYILAARPSVGKSSFAQALGMTQAKADRKVLFLSQEMAEEELADRGVANSGRIDYSNLLSGRLSDDDWHRATEALEAHALANFYVDDQPSLTLGDVRAKAKQVPNLSMLVLDYLQLCAGKGDNRNSEIEQISRGLKALAKELGITVLALSQLNRQVEQRASKRPNLSDLRDSGAIEQDADVVMFLWPVNDFGNGSKLIGLGLDKNRQGRGGQFGLHFEGNYQRWDESTESIEPRAETKRERGFNG